jgi:hypothetical protein
LGKSFGMPAMEDAGFSGERRRSSADCCSSTC